MNIEIHISEKRISNLNPSTPDDVNQWLKAYPAFCCIISNEIFISKHILNYNFFHVLIHEHLHLFLAEFIGIDACDGLDEIYEFDLDLYEDICLLNPI